MDEVSYGWSAHLQNEKMMRHANNILDWLKMGKGRNIIGNRRPIQTSEETLETNPCLQLDNNSYL